MSYRLLDIEGIGETYEAKLNKQNLFTTIDLLENCGNKKARETLAENTGIPESLILTWVNHADLMRVKGIGAEYSELLEASGIDTVKELATRNADNLYLKMKETNDQFGLSGRVPSAGDLQDMIDQAKKLEQMVFH